eukprot:TRINITY_DN41964_c0_g1_i1.p1 TRINITY_DN41964_c0_g1~~TRINITY_DN41964_c0_g1_i1.p1  ORF type:complete len:268 (-),score=48.80 TRINITY_DN41964_c0_g1_i1:72-875(-)
MQGSSSEPVLRQEDYHLPCNGVGDTGHARRVILGIQSKDTGGYSSRINQIVKAAGKVPGPGKYMAHEDWKLNKGAGFGKGTRDYKPMHKNPDPTHYERKDFFSYPSNASKECFSKNARVKYGKMPTGKRRSFLDGVVKQSAQVPAPGHYTRKHVCNDRLDYNVTGALNWTKEVSSGGKMAPDKSLAPNHYSINYASQEPKQPVYTVPKERAANFLDKAVKEKIIDIRNKKEIPGPGTYNQTDINKESRGTYHLQLRGLTRNAMSGYF